ESIKVHIKEIPNSHLYDGKTSLYDIIKLHNTPIMLREHFRCVPEIIGFSNKLSYDNKIKPLRDSSSSILLPPIIPYKVENGKRAGKYKVNEKEAKTIVSLVLACLEQPEYENQTFGVISLLGNDQSKKIQNLIFEKIPMKIIEERKILCGDASNFQGDERDVVFLSLVDSPDDEGPLRFTGEGTEQSNKQRYNVAASRAKNQLWLVHSLDYKNDLKSGDIRRELLDYCYNYKNIAEDLYKIEEKSDSIFEYNVAKSLIEAGYNITQQWTAGAYKIDIVVKCNNNKVAIECDGEKFHGTLEKIKEDNERQSILERLGWRFIRIRGSEYFRDPNITIKRVIQELNNLDIYPEKKELSQNMNFTLKDVVIERAYKIRNEWQKQKNNSLQNPVGQISFSQLNNPKTLNSTPSLPPRERLKKQALKKTIKRDQNNHSKISNQNNNINNSDFLINDLYSLGFDIIDNRKISNILWVIYSPNKKEEFEKTVKNYTFKYSLEFRGSPATKNTPAWRIMT
ncbi:MAG: DUF559 domain-containing protein, partial [Christensenellaceae bacterium]|nr:DUF559 domain-containing protein [Christensenellaceae bacterium]